MSAKADALLHEVLALPQMERARLVAEVLDRLDERPEDNDRAELDRIWAAETERRARQVAVGSVDTESWESVLARVADSRSSR
jgi:putative addiction module component (TIGR02574 family)